MTPRRSCAIALGLTLSAAAAGWLGGPPGLTAQQPHWLGFRGNFGAEVPNGDPAELFQGNIRGEFSLLFQPRPFPPFYFGFGFSWVTFHVQPPYTDVCVNETSGAQEHCEPWNSVGLQLFAGAYLEQWLPLPLYVEGRLIERRLRPMDLRFFDINADNYIKDLPYPECRGFGVEAAIGLQLPSAGRTHVDVATRIGQFTPTDIVFDAGQQGTDSPCRNLNLLPLFSNLPRIQSGWILGLQVGIVWFP